MARAKKEPIPVPVMIYEIINTGCIIRLVALSEGSKPVYEFEYLNRKAGSNKANEHRDKPNFTVYIDDIWKSESMKCWIRLEEIPKNL